MTETEKVLINLMLMIYTNAVVGILAYALGMYKGGEDERKFKRSMLKVGTLWRVGDDGRLHEVYEVDE